MREYKARVWFWHWKPSSVPLPSFLHPPSISLPPPGAASLHDVSFARSLACLCVCVCAWAELITHPYFWVQPKHHACLLLANSHWLINNYRATGNNRMFRWIYLEFKVSRAEAFTNALPCPRHACRHGVLKQKSLLLLWQRVRHFFQKNTVFQF